MHHIRYYLIPISQNRKFGSCQQTVKPRGGGVGKLKLDRLFNTIHSESRSVIVSGSNGF